MKNIFLFAILLSCISPTMKAQEVRSDNADTPNKWYIGADAGISFGRGTLCSFGADKTRVGYGFGVLGGYHINSFLSGEAELRYSHLGLGAYDCCQNLWLGADGNRYYAPHAGMKNYRYGDIFSSVNMYSLGLRLNIDFVQMFKPESRWSFLISPAVYGISSQATVQTVAGKTTIIKGKNQMHFGAGADLGIAYQISELINLRLYTGMTYITGKGIDAMPATEHKSNYTWDTGFKLTFTLGKKATVVQCMLRTSDATQPACPTQAESNGDAVSAAPTVCPSQSHADNAEKAAEEKCCSTQNQSGATIGIDTQECCTAKQGSNAPADAATTTVCTNQQQPATSDAACCSDKPNADQDAVCAEKKDCCAAATPESNEGQAAVCNATHDCTKQDIQGEKTDNDIVYKTTIYFSFNQCDYIEKSQYQTLVGLLHTVTDFPDADIIIEGWADKVGTQTINDNISLSRAKTMQHYLMKKGVAEERISIKGSGVDTNAATDNLARRAEIKLFITEK